MSLRPKHKKKEHKKIWKIKKRNCYSNNIKKFYLDLNKQIHKHNLKIKILGYVRNDPIILLLPKKLSKKNKNLLITGGFHGDEPGGSWGIIEFLEKTDKDFFKEVDLSIIPLVNPTGFKTGSLKNMHGENPNSGFKKGAGSKEDNILRKNFKLLKKLAKDGFLTLHEDYDQKHFYIYSFEKNSTPSKRSFELLHSLKKIYPIFGSGVIDECIAKNGIIFNDHDTSLEATLSLSGVPFCICTETPRGSGIDKRIKANSIIIQKFIESTIKN
jgi:predicted deacylase